MNNDIDRQARESNNERDRMPGDMDERNSTITRNRSETGEIGGPANQEIDDDAMGRGTESRSRTGAGE